MHMTKGSPEPRAGTINILDDQQIEYWTWYFSITETELRYAVFIAGPIVEDVKAYLFRKGKIKQ